jgi:hypothetical protein
MAIKIILESEGEKQVEIVLDPSEYGDKDYVIVVKDNQHKLLDDVMTTFHGPFSSIMSIT